MFWFRYPTCSAEDTFAAKRKIVADQTGTDFQLTAGTGNEAGKLKAELIMDGKTIKVGSGDAAKAGAAAAAKLVSEKMETRPGVWGSLFEDAAVLVLTSDRLRGLPGKTRPLRSTFRTTTATHGCSVLRHVPVTMHTK